MFCRKLMSSKLVRIEPSLVFFSTNLSQTRDSDLHRINCEFSNPMNLFREWFDHWLEEREQEPSFKVCCFSTASKNGEVSSRSLLLRRLDEDGFVIMTDSRSCKIKNITENPQASLVFLWNKYILNSMLNRQLPDKDAQEMYAKEPTFAKIRSHICHQGQPVEWELLKIHHDDYLKKIRTNGDLPKPDHVVSYKIYPQYLEFYEALGKTIADRLLFTKLDSTWKISRIAA